MEISALDHCTRCEEKNSHNFLVRDLLVFYVLYFEYPGQRNSLKRVICDVYQIPANGRHNINRMKKRNGEKTSCIRSTLVGKFLPCIC